MKNPLAAILENQKVEPPPVADASSSPPVVAAIDAPLFADEPIASEASAREPATDLRPGPSDRIGAMPPTFDIRSPAPCSSPTCGSPLLWRDGYGIIRCCGCDSPPRRSMVRNWIAVVWWRCEGRRASFERVCLPKSHKPAASV